MFGRYPGVALLLLLWLALQYAGGLTWWEYSRPALQAGQIWRVLSAHFVHLNDTHLLLNALGLLAITSLWSQALRGWSPSLLAAGIALGVTAGLWFRAEHLSYYAGASGVLHGLFIVGALLSQEIRWPWRLLAILGLLVKLLAEIHVDTGSAQLIGAPVIHAAHQFGALSGFVFCILILAISQRR
ncbi:MAG: rhombosortase [Pseudomonadota bacterium]